ncbi:crotonase/enoyl-CoA hydratase family protein [Candidatus Sumerlaeota bacterium]|nr:crotonase/enoyl-CoA hydratase family protein [Candidatus Sumerlaeota bacterium]
MDYTQIQYDVKDRIATLTLHRPEKMNAFTATMMLEMIDAFSKADEDDAVRVVIVTGSGDRAFCAGADLSEGGKTFDYKGRGLGDAPNGHRDGGGLLALRIFEMRKPVIGAINGAAVGVGATMTLPMDIRLASENAKMGFVFARRGITMEACSGYFLPRLVGVSRAAELVYTGRVFPASEALAHGLVSRVLPADQLLSAARELAGEIAQNTSAVSVAISRAMIWRMLGAGHPMEAHRVESDSIFAMGQSADAREGVMSFLEKRPPQFKMSAAKDIPSFYPWWKDEPF